MPADTSDPTAGATSPKSSWRRLKNSRPPTSRHATTPPFRPSLPICCTTTPAAPPRSTSPNTSAKPWAARASGSSAKICCTPARTKSITAWDRRCSPAAWVNGASSPKPAPDNTAWPPPPCAPCSASSAWSTWAKWTCGGRTLKDAISEAMRDWVTNVGETYYLLGSALGSHPYPMMVRDFQQIIGEEARRQILEAEGHLPDTLIACVGGGSNAIGLFTAFLNDSAVELVGVEAGGRGNALGEHAARYRGGSPGVLQGAYSYLLQDEHGQIALTHSVSAGLDYAMIGPEHAWLHDRARAQYVAASDAEALDAARRLSRIEGILPALESAHAVAEAIKRAPAAKDKIFIVNLSGRGDKDIDIYRENFPELDSQ